VEGRKHQNNRALRHPPVPQDPQKFTCQVWDATIFQDKNLEALLAACGRQACREGLVRDDDNLSRAGAVGHTPNLESVLLLVGATPEAGPVDIKAGADYFFG
jgi:hypothetical protein